MDSKIHEKVTLLKAKRNFKQAEIDLKNAELIEIENELFGIEWVKFSWDELRQWLIENRPKNEYQSNPKISNGMSTYDYCLIDKNGELQIGAYYNNDRFPRGRDIYVAYDFRSYR